jgi:FkbM family methyltransferase
MTLIVIEAGGNHPDVARWTALSAEVHRFDPDGEEAARMSAAGVICHPVALGCMTGRRTLRVMRGDFRGGTSFFEPNTALTDRMMWGSTPMKGGFVVDHEIEVDVVRLDEWAASHGMSRVDFIYANVQGAELEVIKGAGSLLEDVLGAVIEVDFVELYKSAPLFAEVDLEMRSAGLTLLDIFDQSRVSLASSSRGRPGWFVQANTLYLRDLPNCPPDRRADLAMIARAWGHSEFAEEVEASCP